MSWRQDGPFRNYELGSRNQTIMWLADRKITYKEIAKRFNISTGYVGTILEEGRRLRKHQLNKAAVHLFLVENELIQKVLQKGHLPFPDAIHIGFV